MYDRYPKKCENRPEFKTWIWTNLNDTNRITSLVNESDTITSCYLFQKPLYLWFCSVIDIAQMYVLLMQVDL